MNIQVKEPIIYKGKVTVKTGLRTPTGGGVRVIYNMGTDKLFSIIYDFLKNPTYAAQIHKDSVPSSLILTDSDYKPVFPVKLNAISVDKIEENNHIFLRYSFIINSYDIINNIATGSAFIGKAILSSVETDINNLSNKNYLAEITIPSDDNVILPKETNDVLYWTWDLDFTNQTTTLEQ